MKSPGWIVVAVVGLALLLGLTSQSDSIATSSAFAKERGRTSKVAKPAPAAQEKRRLGAADLAYLAAELEYVGREQNEPLYLLAAARLMGQAGGVAAAPSLDGAFNSKDIIAPAKVRLLDDQALVAAAKRAGATPDVQEFVDKWSRAGSFSSIGGGKVLKEEIEGFGVRNMTVPFYSRERATVTAFSERRLPLDLKVYDEGNRQITCQTRPSGQAVNCTWLPRRRGNFKIRVRNLSGTKDKLILYTN